MENAKLKNIIRDILRCLNFLISNFSISGLSISLSRSVPVKMPLPWGGAGYNLVKSLKVPVKMPWGWVVGINNSVCFFV